jgi:hypothetical protein
MTHGCEVSLILYEKALKTALKEMPASVMLTIEPHRVTDTEPLDCTGQIGHPCANEEVIVISQEDIGMHLNLKPLSHLPEGLKELEVVLFLVKDFSFFVAAGEYVVKRIGMFHPNWPCHRQIVS